MIYSRLIEELKGRIETARVHENFSLKKLHVGEGINNVDLRNSFDASPVQLPSELFDVYSSFNGLDLSWEWNENNLSYSSGIHIPRFEIFMSGFGGKDATFKPDAFAGMFYDSLDHLTPSFAKSLRLWDQNAEQGYSVGMQIGSEYQLYISENVTLYKLPLSIEKYISLAVQTLGTEFWQHHLTSPDTLDKLTSYRTFGEIHQKVFGSSPPDPFRKK
jgi:hypothetical protein